MEETIHYGLLFFGLTILIRNWRCWLCNFAHPRTAFFERSTGSLIYGHEARNHDCMSSEVGQQRPSRHRKPASALPPKADSSRTLLMVRFVPTSDISLK